MTDVFFELVSTYGVLLIFSSTFLSCLFLPIPSSLMMLVGGAFAASGDLSLIQVVGSAYVGAVLGDQVGYRIGRVGGPAVIARLSRDPTRAKMLERAQRAVDRHGGLAVFLSTWAFAQIGPWVNVIAGAAQLSPLRFTLWDALGEVFWVCIYVGAGYLFAAQIEAASEIISNASGFLAAGIVTLVLGFWLYHLATRDHGPD